MCTACGPQQHFVRNLHGVWATATFRLSRIRRGEAKFSDPGGGPILWELLLTERSFRRVFGPGEPRSHLGRFRNHPGEARNGTFPGGPRDRNFDRHARTRERRRHTKKDKKKNHDTEDIIVEDAPECKKYQPTSGHLKIELPSRMRWGPRVPRRRRRSRA